jgi:hypothetical protein
VAQAVDTEDNSNNALELLKVLAPYLAMTVLVSVGLVVLLMKFVAPRHLQPAVAAFDVVKYTNAQRAVASNFLRPNADVSATNELLLSLPKRAREVIADVAGPGTVVVVRQAIVQGEVADITDEVLKRLGLPVNVPSMDSTKYSLDEYPTSLSNLLSFNGIRPAEGATTSAESENTGQREVLP